MVCMDALWLTHPACLLHAMGAGHPESPQRLQAIEEHLDRCGLARKFRRFEAPPAEREHLYAVHAPEHVDFVLGARPDGLLRIDADTAMNPYSAQAARAAAGAVVAAVDAVLDGAAGFAFCSVRPPGHHAEAAQAMGFCLFNNVAVGAGHALRRGIRRLAILDFDVHYGNGTASIFSGDARVLVCNTYQQTLYPFWRPRGIANLTEAPLSAGACGDAFRAAVRSVWAPALAAHRPELILVSAGFDAHADDPLAGLALRAEDFGWIGERIRDWAASYCPGRVVATLEGGYDPEALAASVERFVRPFLIQADPA